MMITKRKTDLEG